MTLVCVYILYIDKGFVTRIHFRGYILVSHKVYCSFTDRQTLGSTVIPFHFSFHSSTLKSSARNHKCNLWRPTAETVNVFYARVIQTRDAHRNSIIFIVYIYTHAVLSHVLLSWCEEAETIVEGHRQAHPCNPVRHKRKYKIYLGLECCIYYSLQDSILFFIWV